MASFPPIARPPLGLSLSSPVPGAISPMPPAFPPAGLMPGNPISPAPGATFPMLPSFPPGSLPGMGSQPQLPDAGMINGLITQLGIQTQLNLDGTARFNEPLVAQIVSYREMVLPGLQLFLMSTDRVPALLEGLYAAGKLAESGVKGVEQLYSAAERWNGHPDPLIQMHLARFYRKINEPRTFGPMLATLLNRAIVEYPMQSSPTYNVSEEVGQTVLDEIVRRTTEETVRQLRPLLQNPGGSNPFQMPSTPSRQMSASPASAKSAS